MGGQVLKFCRAKLEKNKSSKLKQVLAIAGPSQIKVTFNPLQKGHTNIERESERVRLIPNWSH